MSKKLHNGILLVLVVAVFLVPILVAVGLAWWESFEALRMQNLFYTQQMLHRIEAINRQLSQGAAALAQSSATPCSSQDIDLLRRIDAGSSAMKAAGRIRGDTLLCTSQGLSRPIALGRPDGITPHGVALYLARDLSERQPYPLNLYALRDFAMIVDPLSVVDIFTETPDVELGVFALSATNQLAFAVRGANFPVQWLPRLPTGTQKTALQDGYIVSYTRPVVGDYILLAATPSLYLNQKLKSLALIFIPTGMLCGAVFALTLSLLARETSRFPTMLRRAIRDGSLYVVYQPVVELATGRIVGAEALLRWRSHSAEMRPEYFLAQARKHGLIPVMTRQLLRLAARDLPYFLRLDAGFRLAIHLAAEDLEHPKTLSEIEECLRLAGAQPANLEMEIPEAVLLQITDAAGILRPLQSKGIALTVDGFSANHASFALLQSLPIDAVKIDRSFLDAIATGAEIHRLVVRFLELARSRGVQITAKGVEHQSQAQYLMRYGVLFAQGWYFGRPMDPGLICEQIRLKATSNPKGMLVASALEKESA